VKRLILALVLVALALPVAASQVSATYEGLTVDATAGGVSLATATVGGSDGIPQMNYCQGVLETAQIRFRDDGGTVTSANGTPIDPGGAWEAFDHATAKATRFIRTGASSGSLKVRCYVSKPTEVR
jgi:hypothetical protein